MLEERERRSNLVFITVDVIVKNNFIEKNENILYNYITIILKAGWRRMAHIPVKKIETLLVLADEDKQKQKEFYETLLTTHVYVAGTVDIEEGDSQGIVHLRYFQGDGRWILPFFTQLEFLQAALPEDAPVISIRGKELFESIDVEATAVLNIGTDLDKTFTPPEIADIASGRIFNYYQ